MSTTSSPTSVTPGGRSYGQYCPVAVGLDLIGDRWTLLICRELAIGDARFTDLRTTLRGIAPNLLSERLRSLQAAGLVEVVDLPPPAARTVYRLTESGRGVVPVLRAVARFGVQHLDGEPSEWFTARRAVYALLLPFQRTRPDRSIRTRLDFGDGDTHDVLLAPDKAAAGAPEEGDADLVVHTTAAALVAARQGEPLIATFDGTKRSVSAFLTAFELGR